MDKRKLIRLIKEELELTSFTAVGKGVGTVSLKRDQEEIVLPYESYSGQYVLGPHLSVYKTFDIVEDVLEKYFKKQNVFSRRITIKTQSRRCEDRELRTIRDIEDIKSYKKVLGEMIFEDALPFFEKYTNIIEINKQLNFIDESEWSRFLCAPNAPRAMVIKRLTNSEDWDSFCQEKIEAFRIHSHGKYRSTFEPIYKFLPDLYAELKEMELPSWNEL